MKTKRVQEYKLGRTRLFQNAIIKMATEVKNERYSLRFVKSQLRIFLMSLGISVKYKISSPSIFFYNKNSFRSLWIPCTPPLQFTEYLFPLTLLQCPSFLFLAPCAFNLKRCLYDIGLAVIQVLVPLSI